MSTKTKSLVKPSKPFSRLTKAEKRVAIAKDVIEQVKLKVLIAGTGRYFNLIIKDQYFLGSSERTTLYKEQLNSAMVEKKVICDVCAKGALFACHILRTNYLSVEEGYYNTIVDSNITARLGGIFDVNQLNLIEAAFERGVVSDNNNYLEFEDLEKQNEFGENETIPTSIAKKAIKFGKRFSNENNRLIAICNNIVANKGIFIP